MPIEILSAQHLYNSWTARGAAALDAYRHEQAESSCAPCPTMAAAPFLIVAGLVEGVAKGALALVVLLPHLLCGAGSEFFYTMGYGFVASLVTAGVLLPALLFASCCCADDGRLLPPQRPAQNGDQQAGGPPVIHQGALDAVAEIIGGNLDPLGQQILRETLSVTGNGQPVFMLPTLRMDQLPPQHTLTLGPDRVTSQTVINNNAPNVDFKAVFMPLLAHLGEIGAIKTTVAVAGQKMSMEEFLPVYEKTLEQYNEWAKKPGTLTPEQTRFLAYLRDRAQYFQARYHQVVQNRLSEKEQTILGRFFGYDATPDDEESGRMQVRQHDMYNAAHGSPDPMNAQQRAATDYYRELRAFFFRTYGEE